MYKIVQLCNVQCQLCFKVPPTGAPSLALEPGKSEIQGHFLLLVRSVDWGGESMYKEGVGWGGGYQIVQS